MVGNLQGASRMTGGILCGRAHGNNFNFADATLEDESQESPVGKVYVYKTHGDPHVSKPYMTLKHEVTMDLAPVLEDLALHYSPVSSKWVVFRILYEINFFVEKNQRVFVFEDDLWAVKAVMQLQYPPMTTLIGQS